VNNSPRFTHSHHFSLSNSLAKSHPLPTSDLDGESAELSDTGLFSGTSIIHPPSFGFSKCFVQSDDLIKSNIPPEFVFSFPTGKLAAGNSFEGKRLDSSRDSSPSEQLVQSDLLGDSASPADFPTGERHEISSFESMAMVDFAVFPISHDLSASDDVDKFDGFPPSVFGFLTDDFSTSNAFSKTQSDSSDFFRPPALSVPTSVPDALSCSGSTFLRLKPLEVSLLHQRQPVKGLIHAIFSRVLLSSRNRRF
jgi:hypothetical protein